MNERIKELSKQAGILIDWGEDIKVGRWGIGGKYENMQKFAELIVQECEQVSLKNSHRDDDMGAIIARQIKAHFGVEQ